MRNEHEIHVLSYRKLRPLFLGEVFLLCFSQHLRQLGISAIIGQDEDHLRIRLGIGARNSGSTSSAAKPSSSARK
jgi:hypothetical protein